MNPQVANVFTVFLYVLIGCVLGRSIMSWFQPRPDNPLWKLLGQVTEPLMEPVRRILPRTGAFDFSAMVVIIVLYLMVAVVNQAAG